MKKVLMLVVVVLGIVLTGCNNPEIDRRSPYQSAVDYKRAAISEKKYSVSECDAMIISLDLYRDVQMKKYGDKYLESADADTWSDAKRIFVQTRERRLAGN